jgi:N-formylglutamate amidohydrolase
MRQLILHIPHSSVKIPEKDGFVVSDEIIQGELNRLTDWFTDDLFDSPDNIIVKADFSRIFCDPERFIDDKFEVMSKYGMGVLYDRTDSGEKMRELDLKLREHIIKKYYVPHHKKLTDSVESQLNELSSAIIIDCHSFPDIPLNRDLNKKANRPDINIGIDDFHTPRFLIDHTVNFFENYGYSIGINWPYSGTIVPLKYYNKSIHVYSIMIEINRKLYIDNTLKKSKDYKTLKQIIPAYLNEIKNRT